MFAEGELGQHDRQVDIVRPVKHAGRVGEGQRIARKVTAAADEGEGEVQAGLGVAVEEEALFLAVGLVEDDEAAGGAGGSDHGAPAGTWTVLTSRDHWQR